MSLQQKIHIKLQYGEDLRRFIIDPDCTFNDLKQKITTLLRITTPFSILYIDEENEWITIGSDAELKIGIDLATTLLRLKIESNSATLRQTVSNLVEERANVDNVINIVPNPVEEKTLIITIDPTSNKDIKENVTNAKEKSYKKWKKNKRDGDFDAKKNKRKKKIGDYRKEIYFVESDSDSLEDRPVEEIKRELSSLKEEIGLLKVKKKNISGEAAQLKNEIKTLRQNESDKEAIIILRQQLAEKKKGVKKYKAQIYNSKNRIWRLKNVIESRLNQ